MSREKPCLEMQGAPHHRNTETENRPERPPRAARGGTGRGRSETEQEPEREPERERPRPAHT